MGIELDFFGFGFTPQASNIGNHGTTQRVTSVWPLLHVVQWHRWFCPRSFRRCSKSPTFICDNLLKIFYFESNGYLVGNHSNQVAS